MLKKFAHVINPVMVGTSSDLFVAQPVTFETMRIARRFATEEIEVGLYSIHFPEDEPVAPADFIPLPSLERSVLDFGQFQRQRKLPLLRDILNQLYEATDAEYTIYTNVDIGLLPHFYVTIRDLLESGTDALVVNRRTISNRFSQIDEIPLMYTDLGVAHRGWDCFIFRRELYPQFVLGELCVGATRVGLGLLANMVAFSRTFQEFSDLHLTFHIGDERPWIDPDYLDYDEHNNRELMKILAAIENNNGPFDRDSIPGSFLWRKRTFGPLYEYWSRHVYLPPSMSRFFKSDYKESLIELQTYFACLPAGRMTKSLRLDGDVFLSTRIYAK